MLPVGALVACLALPGHAPSISRPEALPQLLALRGGLQPALAESAAAPKVADRPAISSRGSTRLRSKTVKKRPTRRKARDAFDAQDALNAAVGLSAVGAAGLASGELMAAVPGHLKDVAWMTLGSVLASSLFVLTRVVNADRALTLAASLEKLIFGSTPAAPRSLPTLAVLALLGGAASFQSLPSSAS